MDPVVLAGLVAIMVYTSMGSAKVECQVCVNYGGHRNCGTAAAPTRDEALGSATSVACATLTSGRAQSLECERLEPESSSCQP